MKKNKNIKLLVAIITLAMPQIVFATKYIVCDNDKKIPYIFANMVSTFITIIKIAVPILLVISGMISFFKVASSSNVDDEMKKAKSKLINSIIAAVVIFFVFSIVNFAVSLVAGTNNKFMKCVECFINTDKCETTDETKQLCPGFIDGEYDDECKPIKTEEPTNNAASTNTQNSNTTNSQNTSTNSNNNINTQNTDIKINEIGGATYINGVLIVNKTYSLSSDYAPGSAKGIDQECLDEKCFTNQTWKAYNSMLNGAKFSGINLRIGSGFRSYNFQSVIYNNYVSSDGQEKADTYSARPGHSEHQTGLAMDICSADTNIACITSAFDTTAEAKWLNDNCYKYGFIIRYPQGKESVTGYKYESWHIRYVGTELAQKLYNNGNWITLEEYLGITSKYN